MGKFTRKAGRLITCVRTPENVLRTSINKTARAAVDDLGSYRMAACGVPNLGDVGMNALAESAGFQVTMLQEGFTDLNEEFV
jgi:hypothetical protein